MREANGVYANVVELMKKDGAPETWMLRTAIFLDIGIMPGTLIINCWSDGRIIKDEVMRPLSTDIPSDDILALKDWAEERGWKQPQPSKTQLDSPRGFEFWQRQYQAGLISCTEIEERELDFMRRLTASESDGSDDQKETDVYETGV